MRSNIKLAVEVGGAITAIYSDELAPLIELGAATITRASNVEPSSLGWFVTMIGDDSHEAFALQARTFRRRADALAAEVKYLESRLFSAAVDSDNSGVVGCAGGSESRP